MSKMTRLMRRWLRADGRALARRLDAAVADNARAALVGRLYRPVPRRAI